MSDNAWCWTWVREGCGPWFPMRGSDPNIAGGYEKGDAVLSPTEAASLRAERDAEKARAWKADADAAHATAERDAAREEARRLRESLEPAYAHLVVAAKMARYHQKMRRFDDPPAIARAEDFDKAADVLAAALAEPGHD